MSLPPRVPGRPSPTFRAHEGARRGENLAQSHRVDPARRDRLLTRSLDVSVLGCADGVLVRGRYYGD